MTPQRWQQIEAIFYAALERAQSEQSAYLAEACAEDAALRAEVEALLKSHQEATSFIEQPAYSGKQLNVEEAEWLIGPYRVLRELGRGGMGAVYLAERADGQFQQQVAIKVIKRGMDSDFILSRFRRERQILAALAHPHIAKLLDGGTTADGLPYFVMEYIEGEPLDRYCETRQLSTAARLELFRQVCAAVHYAHQKLIVHRDLKPGNILVTSDGLPKLLDFGIAKLLGPQPGEEAVEATATGMRLLTPGYASPEQARGEVITTASDVYALGVVLNELLTGQKPYADQPRTPQTAPAMLTGGGTQAALAQTAVELAHAATQRLAGLTTAEAPRSEPAETTAKRIDPDLEKIIALALRAEPERRYASAAELADDIERYLASSPVKAQKDSFGYRARKFAQRHRTAVVAAALLVLSLLGGLFATLRQARLARAERARAERRFNEVRELANSFLFEFDSAIEKLPGATPARELLVKRALTYLDRLAQEARDDLALQSELATAYEKVGDIQGNTYYANLGDTTGALASHRKALELRAALLQAAPQNIDHRFQLATSYGKVAAMQSVTNDLKGTLTSYRQAEQLLQAVLAERSDHAGARRNLALCQEMLGETLAELGETAQALEYYRQALRYAEARVAEQPDDRAVRRGLALRLGKLSNLLSDTEAKAEAVAAARRSLTLFQELAQQAEAHDASARRDLAAAYNWLGNVLWAVGDVVGELENYRQSLALAEALAAADPLNKQLRRDLALAYENAGYALAQNGAAAKALTTYRRSVPLFEELAAADPANATARRDLLQCYRYFGDVYALLAARRNSSANDRRERWRAARSWYERAGQTLQELRERKEALPADAELAAELERARAKCDAALAIYSKQK